MWHLGRRRLQSDYMSGCLATLRDSLRVLVTASTEALSMPEVMTRRVITIAHARVWRFWRLLFIETLRVMRSHLGTAWAARTAPNMRTIFGTLVLTGITACGAVNVMKLQETMSLNVGLGNTGCLSLCSESLGGHYRRSPD